jgi:predicted O-methyltransferase YrrM
MMPTYSVSVRLADTPDDIAAGRMNPYSLTEKDMRVLLSLCNERRPTRVLDFGINEGSTAAFILDHCPWIEEWVGVDLIPEKFPERGIVPKKAGWKAAHHPQLRIVLTDETVPDFTRKMEKHIAGSQCCGVDVKVYDLVIADANHEEWPTQRDTEACYHFLKPGGLVVWHDALVESRQHSNGKPFPLINYLHKLIARGVDVYLPDDQPRDPWKCCSLAWHIDNGTLVK